MEDGEGGLSFDFEGGLDAAPTQPTASVPVIHHHHNPSTDNNLPPPPSSTTTTDNNNNNNPPSSTNFSGRRSYRQTVCRHWLRSLCMKGEACGFLHQYDKSRMPICRFFRLYGECREQDCVYKHTNEDIKECNMYKLGFCPNGPDCRYRHAKLPGPPPSVEEVLQKIQQLTSYNYGNSNRFFQNRNANNSQQSDKFQFQNDGIQGAKPSTTDSASMQPVPPLSPRQQQQSSQFVQSQAQSNGQQNQTNKTSIPLPQGTSRYFIVKSCNRENLELSVQQGVWATQRSNEAKLNEAFDSVENVILIFSVNRTRHFQGCARMTSKIGGLVGGGNWKSEHGTAHYGRNFCVRWLKLCELSFHKTRHLRNPYNENLPVKISRDCQELEPSVGEQLASLLYLEPDSELMAISLAAESKREEEKTKGLNLENATENPDIVPFEDNEEEEEEESEEEDDSYDQGFAQGGRGRGGRGFWPPHMPLGRGPRPMPGMRGFPPLMNMMGPDGFPYGGVGPDGFPVPDLMNMGPRGFGPGPFGPRFSGDFQRPPFNNMMFHGRPGGFPGGGGFGMMMGPGPGPGRGPFMGPGGRGGRPGFSQQQQQTQASQNTSRSKRDQAVVSGGDGDSRPVGQNMGGPDDEAQHGGENRLKNGESESEDEAPRRSRHGETKKRRGGSEGDAATTSGDKI